MPRLIDADEIKLPQGFFEKVDNVPKFYKWLDEQPTVDAEPVVRCRDCKYFHYDKAYFIQGFPIMGNSVCDKWANGCQTDENGYCFLGERREDANIS